MINHHIEEKIDDMQKKSKCSLCGDRDETVNQIGECSKVVQKEYKTRHDWKEKVIHWELCKRFNFDHTIDSICTN